VLVNTAAGMAVGNPDYVNIGCGMGYEATMYLTTRGVRVTGTDAWSWDAPFALTAEKVAETGDTSLIWEGHKAGRDIGYCHLEKLHNLEALPPHGFTVSCFPTRSRAHPQAGPAPLPSSRNNHAPCNLAQWAPRWRTGGRFRWRALSLRAGPDGDDEDQAMDRLAAGRAAE
jgi:hypothetical protein